MDEFNAQEALSALNPETAKVGNSPVFPKYQWSIFAGEGKNEQYVIRDNDMAQFQIAVKAIKANLGLRAMVQPAAQVFVPDNTTMPCPIHGVVMTQAVSKKTNKPYWYHDSPTGEGRCFDKGYMPSNR